MCFIVHGKDNTVLKELKALLKGDGVNTIILHEQPSKGMTLIEKLEEYFKTVGFAFIILTTEDVGMGQLEVTQMISKAILKKNATQEELTEFFIAHPTQFGKAMTDLIKLFKQRARQNVILEFGYFIGKLGRGKVCCLYKGSIELPSDMSGICYIHFENSVSEVWEIILKELRAIGYETKVAFEFHYKDKS